MKFIFILFVLASCSSVDENCANYSNSDLVDYIIHGNDFSKEGIQYDSSGQSFDSKILDRLTVEVYECLIDSFPHLVLSKNTKQTSWCHTRQIKLYEKSCFSVKIPKTWELSCDGTQQVLKDNAPQEGCISKGLKRDYDKCPCHWRAGIQENEDLSPIIVTTPSLYLYKDPLVRYLTSCDAPWVDPVLANCMVPTTNPLDLNAFP